MGAIYHFNDASYTSLAAHGLDWPIVNHILREGHPQIRRHIGAVLQVSARSHDGTWIGVVLIEEDDDTYLVVTARELTAEEAANIEQLFGGTP